MKAFRVRSRAGVLRLCAALAVCSLISLVLLDGCTDSGSPGTKDGPTTTRPARPVTADALQNEYQKVIKNVLPSVVQIQAGNSQGSGVVFDDKGHIVTNAHVVGDQTTFSVTTANSVVTLTAHLVFSYQDQDLAVIKLDKTPAGLKAAAFGNSAKVEAGQIVLAMGSPLGLSSSVTQGIVSATARTVSEGPSNGAPGPTIPNMVQTSAPINPGNSGGALVNLEGQVIGIPTIAAIDQKFGGTAPGIGFAIPASMVKTVADQIVKSGKVTNSGRASLNMVGRTVLDITGTQPIGVAVADVTKGGAADKAGLQVGDIITKVDLTDITTITSLAEVLAGYKPGQKTTVTYTRNGAQNTVVVTLGEV